ncbi:hypothetical protein [Zophobihabitans entericus]|uniref:Uncharacterized protein n=1 Tax=Zophobihabitans entericus TaxID=1635327 RepID=A0A6G9IFD1_9GAMM|nr:hypothetical protein [Zophobihabitans entericus]QIQ22300.1 hypothetical protein IPMB12_11750 [Zophobihabitans entericus]
MLPFLFYNSSAPFLICQDKNMDTNNNNKPQSGSFFQLNTKKTCQQAITVGWIAAVISCLLTLAVAMALSPYFYVDVVLLAVLAFFVYKKSRVASTILVVYFVASKLLQISWGISPGQLIFALLFIFCYVQAMRATYIWHKNYADSKPEEPGTLVK